MSLIVFLLGVSIITAFLLSLYRWQDRRSDQ